MKRSFKQCIVVAGTLGVLAVGAIAGRASAGGIPAKGALTYSGVLLKPDGTPLSSDGHNLEIKLWSTGPTGGTAICDTAVPAAMFSVDKSGRFSVPLDDTCTSAIASNAGAFVEVLLDGNTLGRTKLGAVPYAIEANHALSADGAVNATNATNATNAGTANAAGGALASAISTLQSQTSTLLGRLDLKAYAKGGNNGSVSCDTFCAGSQWGKVGTCVGSNLNGAYIPCATNLGIVNASVGVCYCAAP